MNTLKGPSGMPTLESGIAAVITKFGWLKLATLGAALAGAAIMAAFRPPISRKELFLQAIVALTGSFMFGPLFIALVDSWLHVGQDVLIAPVHGLIGAMSWGAFGGLAHYRDKLSKDPKGAIQDVKDLV